MSRYADSHIGHGHAHVHAATRSYSPSRFDRLMDEPNLNASALQPYIARSEPFDTRSRGASTVIEEPVVEHEHHHIHHHIDHIGSTIHAPSPRSSFHEIDEDKYYSTASTISVNRSGRDSHRRSVDYRSSGTHSRRGSVQVSGTSDWTIIDVPPGTTMITLDTTGAGYREEEYSESRHEAKNGIRRSRGTSQELWTEITKDLITAEAIRDMGYQFEETDHFYYIFEYLTREQIEGLIQLTADVRRHRAKQLEYESIASSNSSSRTHLNHIERFEPRSHHHHDHHHDHHDRPEIVYTEESVRRARKKYYH